MAAEGTLRPGGGAAQLALNMKLLGHHELAGFGGVGEGINMQKAKDGRRILWMAHESAPKNFTAVDVTDPRNPKLVVQTDLPHNDVRSNSLDVVGDIMAVAYQTKKWGLKPAGMDLFDISIPEKPKLISHFDTSGPCSRGAHCVFFVDGEYVHLTSGSADFEPTHPKDDQFYRIIDVRNPSKPKPVGHLQYSPPYNGFSHTVLPLIERGYLVVSDECVRDNGEDWPKLTWVVDARVESNLVPIATFPLPPAEVFTKRGGRYGSHNLHENQPGPCSFRSETLIFGTYFNGGVRVFDLSNPLQPKEVGYFVPATPKLAPKGSAQINDVWVDEKRIVYAVDRFGGGLYTLETTF